MNGHVLALHRKFHWEWTDLDHLADFQTNRERNLVTALVRIPVHEHVRRRTDAPSMAGKILEEVLDVHLAHVLRTWATDRESLLWKDSREPFVAEVSENARWSQLPLILSKPRVTRGREDKTGPECEQPRTGKFRTGGEHRSDNCVAETGYTMKIAALIHVRRRVQHLEHRTGD